MESVANLRFRVTDFNVENTFPVSDRIGVRKRRGPQSLCARAQKPKHMGMRARISWRLLAKKSKDTKKAYRSGYYRFWEFAEKELKEWGIPEPNSFSKSNQLGGVVYASPGEYRKKPLSGDRCARVIELAYEKGATDATIKQMSKCASHLYQLKSGVNGDNFPDVKGMIESFDPLEIAKKKFSTLPQRIPSVEDMVTGLTKEWDPSGPLSLVRFLQGHTAFWEGFVLGNRSKEDFARIKFSDVQWFGEDCWTTKFLGGRAKLQMKKANTRDWWSWKICWCPNGKHIPPPEDMEYSFDADGNSDVDTSKLCTVCPLFTGQLFNKMHNTERWHVYRQWCPKKRGGPGFGRKNHGNIVNLAMEFARAQGILGPDESWDSNSGRKALARWLTACGIEYPEGFVMHGDLPKTWKQHYQRTLKGCDRITDREQPTDPAEATWALRKLRTFCGRDAPPLQPPESMNEVHETLLLITSRLACRDETIKIFRKYGMK